MKKEVNKINAKAQKFIDFLELKQIKCFQQEQVDDEFNTMIFRSRIEINGNNLPLLIILDNSIYGMIHVQVIPKALNNENKEKVLEYLNEENAKYKVFKYYLTANGGINLDSCVLLTNEQANGEMLYCVIDVIIKYLQENYPKLMSKVWG